MIKNSTVKTYEFILPCYNVENYIEEAIKSLQFQTKRDFTILCIDDCSTDNTFQKLVELSKNDERLKIIKNETNLGLIKTLNKLISISEADILIRMDPDDLSDRGRFEYIKNEFESDISLDLLSSSYRNIDEKGLKIINKSLMVPTLKNSIVFVSLFNSPFAHATVAFKRSIFDKYHYDQSFVGAEDYKLWSELILSKSIKYKQTLEKFYSYRIHGSSQSKVFRNIQVENHHLISSHLTKSIIKCDKQKIITNLLLNKTNVAFIGQFKSGLLNIFTIYNIFIKDKNLTRSEKKEIKCYFNQIVSIFFVKGFLKGNLLNFIVGFFYILIYSIKNTDISYIPNIKFILTRK